MRELPSAFTGLAGELRDRIAAPEQIVRRPVEAILVPPPWHAGRTVLIGDAVHAPPPTLAAGAAIVLEDAVVLDEMLAAGGDVEETLRAFVDRRWERCRLVVEQSVARTRDIIDPTPDFDVAAFERRVMSTWRRRVPASISPDRMRSRRRSVTVCATVRVSRTGPAHRGSIRLGELAPDAPLERGHVEVGSGVDGPRPTARRRAGSAPSGGR